MGRRHGDGSSVPKRSEGRREDDGTVPGGDGGEAGKTMELSPVASEAGKTMEPSPVASEAGKTMELSPVATMDGGEAG